MKSTTHNPAALVGIFNAAVKVGDVIRYHEIKGEGEGKHYRTRTPAEVLQGHSAVVWLEGKSGCVASGHCVIYPNQAAALEAVRLRGETLPERQPAARRPAPAPAEERQEAFRQEVAAAVTRIREENANVVGPPKPPRPLQCRMGDLLRELVKFKHGLEQKGNDDAATAADACCARIQEVLREWAVDQQAFMEVIGFAPPARPTTDGPGERPKVEKVDPPCEISDWPGPDHQPAEPWAEPGFPVQLGATVRHRQTNHRVVIAAADVTANLVRLELREPGAATQAWDVSTQVLAREFDSFQPHAPATV